MQCNAACTGLCLHCIPVGYINAWIYVPQSAIYTLLYFAYTLSLSHLTTLNPQYRAFESILQQISVMLYCRSLCGSCIATYWRGLQYNAMHRDAAGCTCILVLAYLYLYTCTYTMRCVEMQPGVLGCSGAPLVSAPHD